jgi:hypothetical protein
MKIFLFIVLAIILIAFFIKRKAKNSNPIDSITKNGMLGMQLGDTKEFVISRLNHLGLSYKDTSSILDASIITAENVYNHIDHIHLGFKQGKLDCISIYFVDKKRETKEFAEIIAYRISTRLGQWTYSYTTEKDGIYQWFGRHIELSYFELKKDDETVFALRIGE